MMHRRSRIFAQLRIADGQRWWVRPYRVGRGRLLIVAWEFFGLVYLHWTTVRLFDLNRPGAIALAVFFLLVWAIGSWQVMKMGVYVNDVGIRLRGIVTLRTLRWADIDRIVVRRATHQVGPVRVPSGLTVLLERSDGSAVNTPLWADGIDFHGRPEAFRGVCEDLRRRQASASTTGARI